MNLLTSQKIKILKKWKSTRRYYHFTLAYQMYIIWCTVPEITSMIKWFFLLFWAIFCHFTPLTTWKINILKKWKTCLEISSFYTCVPKMTIIWCMVHEIWSPTDWIFCHFGLFFVLLPLYHPGKSKFWKNETNPGDIIILHLRSINENRMMDGYRYMEHNRQNIFSFWTIFCLFTSLTTQKIKI